MQGVGAACLAVSLGVSATLLALTQTASSLPLLVFALPAAAIGDIVDDCRQHVPGAFRVPQPFQRNSVARTIDVEPP
jgi:hypothetical protein